MAEVLSELSGEIDYAAFDVPLRHPTYAKQGWVSIVNPGPATEELARTLLVEAHARAGGPVPAVISFRTTIELGGKTAPGFRVPSDVVDGLGSGRKPKVVVTIGEHSYRMRCRSASGGNG